MFKGSMVALVTPFRSGKLDEVALKELGEFHIKKTESFLKYHHHYTYHDYRKTRVCEEN